MGFLIAERYKISYGHIFVAASFITLAIGGTMGSAFSIFYVAFMDEFGWSRSNTALAFSLSMITFAAGGYAVGSFVDKRGARIAMPLGALIMSFGLLLSSLISSLWELYFVFGVVIALGITLTGQIPNSVVISSWFKENRATAMGVAFAGRGVGALFMFPLIQHLITTYGWRRTYLYLATLIMSTILPMNLFLQRSRWARAKQAAVSNSDRLRLFTAEHGGLPELPYAPNWNVRTVLRSGKFWLFFISGTSLGLSFSIVMVHQVAHTVGAGFSKMAAASAFGAAGLLRSIGGIIGGGLSDRLGRGKAYAISAALSSAGLMALIWLPFVPDTSLLWIYVLLYGLGNGAGGTISASTEADVFHGDRFGSVLGLMHIGTGLGGAVGPWLGGYIFDSMRSYTYAFILVLLFTWVSCFCIWKVGSGGPKSL